MDITGQQVIPATRDAVWKALTDPQVLKACLPGCESVEQTSPEEFKVVIKAVIGPLRARFQGALRVTDANPPESCVMHFEGQGGPVGFGKGSSQVTLRETHEGTELLYAAKAQVGGKLAQVGSRLIDSVAKKMADDFFRAFRQQVAPPLVVSAAATDNQAGVFSPEAAIIAAGAAGAAATPASLAIALTRTRTGDTLVPGWWLAPAALLGAFLAIAGARFLH